MILAAYFGEIFQLMQALGGVRIERYEKQFLSATRGNLRLRLRFADQALLEISEDTVFVCQAVFLPQRIIWIKRLVFFHHGPRDMQQFPCGGTAGHFLWLADLP